MGTPESDVRAFLNRVAPAGAQESLGSAAMALAAAPQRNLVAPINKAVDKARVGKPLDAAEQMVLEAIVIPDKRPAIRIKNGDFAVAHPLWLHFGRPPIKDAIKAMLPSVGRIDLPGHPSLPYGGTGFVVGKNLLMTNRHVAEIFASGLGLKQLVFNAQYRTGIDFKREDAGDAAALLGVRKVVMIHPYWDMALLSVDGLGPAHVPLKLSLRAPESMKGSEVAVIGYPAFDPRNSAEVQNQVFEGVYNVKRLQPGLAGARESIDSFDKTVNALTHDSSTLGGNSGSVVFDPRTREVIALHFAGLYLKANYGVPAAELGRDGRVIDAGVTFTGTPSRKPAPWDSYWKNADLNEEVDGAAAPAPQASPAPTLAVAAGAMTFSIPLEISVRLGGGAPAAVAAAETEGLKEVQHSHDDLSERKGFDQGFLGVPVPLPMVKDPANAAPLEDGGTVLNYHHFSVVMHKSRRVALFTASNLNNRPKARRPDPGKSYSRKALSGLGPNDQEKWFPDPRLDAQYQLPDRFYTKDDGAFDKGHIVRREDVTWGDTYDEIVAANGDTFHTTNCSPQIAGFNQSQRGDDNWGDLEDYVAKQSASELLSVLAGPVLAKDDQVFVGVDDEGPVRMQIPRKFWKIVLAAAEGKLQSFAFLLEQDLSDTPLEFVADAKWEKYMIAVADLEALVGVKFDKAVHAGDQHGSGAGENVRKKSGAKLRPKTRRPRRPAKAKTKKR
ncbi:MAG: DNA/RNA non-specific endonuclease [Rhizomicrobium sp.]